MNCNLPHYIGKIHPNCDYHHGQITPVKGVKCYQISRASASKNDDDLTGCTYKHAADIAYCYGRFYVQYLCNPKDEHTGAGVCVLSSSKDGVSWDKSQISFPAYKIPACTITDYKGETHSFDGSTYAFNHHRMCFFNSSNGKTLLLSFYGWSPQPWVCNWDNYGIGRVVRELYPDGSLGDIYFIRPCWQGGWSEELLNYPLYNKATDGEFIAACDELLSSPLYVQQWAEENGDNDELITIKHSKKGDKNQAFCWYHIDERTVIGLWKHSLTARSDDNGKTWSKVERSPSLVMSGQKVWGCKTSDGRFAMVYDPTMETQHRYPLCVTTSSDGLAFDKMLLVHGEVPPMRYEGFWKDLGPQYMRGICEGLDTPPDGDLWVTYSVNKEDIWVAHIPVPIVGEETQDIDERFETQDSVKNWNLYCPKLARAELADNALRLTDSEPFDYCKVERLFKKSAYTTLTFTVTPRQNDNGCLYVEACNDKAQIAARLIFRDNGKLYARTVAEIPVIDYVANRDYEISLTIDCNEHTYTIAIDGNVIADNDGNAIIYKFMSAVNDVSRFVLRTGAVRHNPTLDDIPDNKPESPLEECEKPLPPTVYDLKRFIAKAL